MPGAIEQTQVQALSTYWDALRLRVFGRTAAPLPGVDPALATKFDADWSAFKAWSKSFVLEHVVEYDDWVKKANAYGSLLGAPAFLAPSMMAPATQLARDAVPYLEAGAIIVAGIAIALLAWRSR